MPTYTVRAFGHAAWEEGLPSLEAAKESQEEARDRGIDARIFRVDDDGTIQEES